MNYQRGLEMGNGATSLRRSDVLNFRDLPIEILDRFAMYIRFA